MLVPIRSASIRPTSLFVLAAAILLGTLATRPAVASGDSATLSPPTVDDGQDDGQLPLDAEPAEWGEVSAEELRFTEHPGDDNASAVILSDVGTTSFTRNGKIKLERHTRIKILDESAYDAFGTVELTYYADDRAERVKDVDGQTFVMEDGEIREIELDNDDIFEEDLDDTYSRVSFTLPNLEPGAVIEYRYEIIATNPIFLRSWRFQTSEPTLYSDYSVEIPDWAKYATIIRGSSSFDEKTSERIGGMTGRVQKRRWVSTRMPALREEPFMTTLRDHRQSISFQLRSITDPRTGRVIPFMEDWGKVAETLMNERSFGRQLGRHSEVKSIVEGLTASVDAPDETVERLYTYVQRNLEWTGEHGIYAPDGIDDVLERRRGTGSEINLLLCSMLQIAGLDAHPVLISTRDHGQMMPLYPFLDQFNAVAVAVVQGETLMMLDATDPHRPAGTLPKRAQNGQGWMVKEDSPTWITIPPTGRASRTTLVRATVSPDGTVEGSVHAKDASYTAVEGRKKLADSSPDAFARTALFDTEASVSDVQVTGLDDPSQELSTKASFELPAYAQVAGDFLYVNPMMIGRQEANPLERPTRQTPIDLPAPRSDTHTISMAVPEGYEVVEVPENKMIRLGEQVFFQRLAQDSGSMVSVRVRHVMGQTHFEPDAYDAVRSFYQEVVDASSAPIVLRRVAEAETGAPGGSASPDADTSGRK